MKKIALLFAVSFFGFSQSQTQIDVNQQVEKQKVEHNKTFDDNQDSRVFVVNELKTNSLKKESIKTKEEILKNKKGYKRVNLEITKARKKAKQKERKSLKKQNKVFKKLIKKGEKKTK